MCPYRKDRHDRLHGALMLVGAVCLIAAFTIGLSLILIP
jgi:hypothetical protein